MGDDVEARLAPLTAHHCYGSVGGQAVAGLWKAGYKPASELDACSEGARAFYEAQNALLERLRDAAAPCPVEQHETPHVHRAIVASNICNAILLVAQMYAFCTSGALALLAVFVDATLDMVSGIVVACTWYLRRRSDKHRYPVGRSRLEPLGVIAMACLMTAATLLTLEESLKTLFQGRHDNFVGLSLISGGILLSALFTKASLYLYCHKIPHMSVQALAEDHFNDCLGNSVSFVTVLVAQKALWWLDPVGGILISCLIIRNWANHTFEHFDQLLGRIAPSDVHSIITFVACHHSDDIRMIDTVRAYHVGNGIYAEVDVVLSAEMPLRDAHDVGESLQVRIETIAEVERCFVHLDFETSHSPTAEHKEV